MQLYTFINSAKMQSGIHMCVRVGGLVIYIYIYKCILVELRMLYAIAGGRKLNPLLESV